MRNEGGGGGAGPKRGGVGGGGDYYIKTKHAKQNIRVSRHSGEAMGASATVVAQASIALRAKNIRQVKKKTSRLDDKSTGSSVTLRPDRQAVGRARGGRRRGRNEE